MRYSPKPSQVQIPPVVFLIKADRLQLLLEDFQAFLLK
jgi:hypothetical protein